MGSVKLSELLAPPFHAVHADICQHAHHEYWLKGGRGSCKSSFVSLEIVLGMMREPEVNAIIYRKVADTLRDSVYAQMVWALEALGVLPYWQCKVSPMELIYRPTGQRIMFRGADDPQKSKGIKLANGYFGLLWFEELTEFSGMGAVRTIKASVIRQGEARTFYTYNPPITAINWVNEAAMCACSAVRKRHRSTHALPSRRPWRGWAIGAPSALTTAARKYGRPPSDFKKRFKAKER